MFSNFSCMFLNPNNFSNLNSDYSNLLDMRNIQEQVKKAFCYQKLFWPLTVWINCSSDLKNIENSLNFNCSNLSSLRNLQEQVKKAFCYQKLFWPFTVWINCSSDLKKISNSRLSALNFKSFSQSLNNFLSQYVRTILVTKYHFFLDLLHDVR